MDLLVDCRLFLARVSAVADRKDPMLSVEDKIDAKLAKLKKLKIASKIFIFQDNWSNIDWKYFSSKIDSRPKFWFCTRYRWQDSQHHWLFPDRYHETQGEQSWAISRCFSGGLSICWLSIRRIFVVHCWSVSGPQSGLGDDRRVPARFSECSRFAQSASCNPKKSRYGKFKFHHQVWQCQD